MQRLVSQGVDLPGAFAVGKKRNVRPRVDEISASIVCNTRPDSTSVESSSRAADGGGGTITVPSSATNEHETMAAEPQFRQVPVYRGNHVGFLGGNLVDDGL